MRPPCECGQTLHAIKLVVLTGGPGAGKTSVLELVRRSFCDHVAVLPEAAGIVFGGGFPRRQDLPTRRASQRAIYRIQAELEALVLEEKRAAVALCDRGRIDGVAYWPDPPESYWAALGTTRDAELARYAAVIHLRTPPIERGYDHSNALRIESAVEAAETDDRIAHAWDGHPRRFFVGHADEFLSKVASALQLVRAEVPECCRGHKIPELDGWK